MKRYNAYQPTYIINKVKSRFDNSMGNLQPSTSTWVDSHFICLSGVQFIDYMLVGLAPLRRGEEDARELKI